MLNTSSNRATPISGDNITKIIRQHYKPKQPTQYEHEHVRCRTETSCQKNKDDDYWTINYCRRRRNLDRGFYTSNTIPYRPIGGNLILDPYELVLSALPGNVEKKFHSRMTKKGTVYEFNTPTDGQRLEEQLNGESLEDGDDNEDACPTAGFNDIKKLLQESRERVKFVQAGGGYEDHIQRIEHNVYSEDEAISAEDKKLVLHTASSLFLPVQTSSDKDNSLMRLKAFDPLSRGETRKLTIFSAFTPLKQNTKRVSPIRRFSRPASSLRSSPATILKSPESEKSETESGKLTLIRCFSGVTKAIYKKERQLNDHFLFLQSIFNVLTAMHNMKLKDIRSKVPLCKELVVKLQKEGHQRDDDRSSRGTYEHKYSRASKMSTVDIDTDQQDGRYTVLGTVKRMMAVENVGKNHFGRRRSRNAASIYSDKPAGIETWEDLLNAQPPEFKAESPTLGLQVGIVTKFMKWFRKASIGPTLTGGGLAGLDRDTMSHLSNIQDRSHSSDKTGDRESVYGQLGPHQSRAGSGHAMPERTRKLPIWQQVAQEKSTVFHNKKTNAPNVDATIPCLQRNMKSLKCSLQKENTAELEKIVRERLASFRLKFGTLGEDCSPLFEKQMNRVQRANDINRSQLENLNVQPSKWYEELKEKAATMMATYDDSKINEILHKLQTYAHMDNKTLHVGKAKLCLLMMSLPAYDICQIYMQKALKFIFEKILLGQGAQFDEWLNLREIPYVVLEEMRPRSGINA